MKREFIFTLALFLSSLQCYAYDLVLPREKKMNVTSNYAFFVGKARNSENILINDEKVYIAENGAFAHSVKLKDGENRIVVRSNYNTQIYKFYKTKPVDIANTQLFELEPKKALVKRNNIPLRSTPVDAGMNRISHLFKDTELIINATKNGFYRVLLEEDKFAWVAQKDVDLMENTRFEPAEFLCMEGKNFKNATQKMIGFTKNLPYTIEELDDEILFKVYNPELSPNSVYTLNIPKPEKYIYNVALEEGLYSFKVNSIPNKIEDVVIAIDAGHGGNERGAIGCLGDEEKNINLKIALELKEQLQQMGANVVMTRECDGNMSLEERTELAKKNNSHIFVSIHLNSIGDIPMNVNKNRGTSVYYFNKNSKGLAAIVEKTVSDKINTRRDGVRAASFAVIRPTEYVGILVETAYMTNPNDSVIYTADDFAYKAAKGIAEGILEFINK